MSLLVPEDPLLKIMSGLLAIMGTTLSIIKGIWTDTLGHAYNFGFIVVTHIATLEHKHDLFILEFKRLATELCLDAPAKLEFITKFLTPTDFVIYDNHLRGLNTLDSVKLYAQEIVLNLGLQFETLHKKTPFNLTNFVTLKTIIISVVVVSILIGAFFYFSTPDNGGNVIKLASAGTKSAETMTNVATDSAANATSAQGLSSVASSLSDSAAQTTALCIKHEIQITDLSKNIMILKQELANCGVNQTLFFDRLTTQNNFLKIVSEKIGLHFKAYDPSNIT
jgi:hypothetical protein